MDTGMVFHDLQRNVPPVLRDAATAEDQLYDYEGRFRTIMSLPSTPEPVYAQPPQRRTGERDLEKVRETVSG